MLSHDSNPQKLRKNTLSLMHGGGTEARIGKNKKMTAKQRTIYLKVTSVHLGSLHLYQS